MGTLALGAFSFVRGVPLLIWPLVLVCMGFLYERHEVKVYRDKYMLLEAQNATQAIHDLQAANAESARRNEALKKETDDANDRAAVAAANAASSAAAAGRMSGELAAVKRRFATTANDPAASGDLQAARAAVGVLTDLLGERKRADAARSKFADAAIDSSLGCGKQYESLGQGSLK